MLAGLQKNPTRGMIEFTRINLEVYEKAGRKRHRYTVEIVSKRFQEQHSLQPPFQRQQLPSTGMNNPIKNRPMLSKTAGTWISRKSNRPMTKRVKMAWAHQLVRGPIWCSFWKRNHKDIYL